MTTAIRPPRKTVKPSSIVKKPSTYNVSSIRIYKDLDGIRQRPTMYLGENGDPMVFQMLKEIVDNSIDEAMVGRNSLVSVVINTDKDEYMVYDKGHGVPTGQNSEHDVNTLTAVFSMIHAGGKFDDKAYESSAGTFGTGSAAVNAVSLTFHVWTCWENVWYNQAFRQGKATTLVREQEPPHALTDRITGFDPNKGTLIRFVVDQSVVSLGKKPAKLDLAKAVDYLKTASYLNPKLHIYVRSDQHNKTLKFLTQHGIQELLKHRIEKNKVEYVSNKVFTFTTPDKKLSACMAWTDDDTDDEFWSYVNGSRTIDGGKHVDGFFAAYQKALSAFVAKDAANKAQDSDSKKAVIKTRARTAKSKTANKSRLQGSFDKVSLRDLKIGLYGVLNLRMSGAVYSSQTKEKLTSDVSKDIESKLQTDLTKFFESNPAVAKSIINRAKTVAQGRESFKQTLKSLSEIKKSSTLFLPNILAAAMDASPDQREVFIVEGQSAMGNAKKARDSSFQEVLALTGKIANAARLKLSRLLSSEPIRNLLLALGANVDDIAENSTTLSTKHLRVNRVYVLADQDPDGYHIAVLVLTVLWRFFPNLYKERRVWVVDGLLYHAAYKGQYYFGDTFDECYDQLPAGAPKSIVVRAKGLAEYDYHVLRYMAFDSATRSVKCIRPPKDSDGVHYFERLIGVNTEERKVLLGL